MNYGKSPGSDDLPHDSDGDALRRLKETGSDLSKPMEIDFSVAVPNQASGVAVAKIAEPLGFRTKVRQDPKSKNWTCYCTCVMVPLYKTIVSIQANLDDIGREYGAKSDGWGSFGNNDS